MKNIWKILTLGVGLFFIWPSFAQMNLPQAIQFYGNEKKKEEIFAWVDQSLKSYGNFGVYGDLSSGLKKLSKENEIEIREMENSYHLSIAPNSKTGHDFSFQIDKKTGKISNLAVGNLSPDPKSKLKEN